MAAAGVRVDGLNAVVRGLLAIGLEVEDLKDSFSAIAARGARVASMLAPKQSGTLAGDVRGNRARSKAVITAGRISVPYAGPINYGWRAHNISPNGFMQRADKVMEPWSLKKLERDINRRIARRGLR